MQQTLQDYTPDLTRRSLVCNPLVYNLLVRNTIFDSKNHNPGGYDQSLHYFIFVFLPKLCLSKQVGNFMLFV